VTNVTTAVSNVTWQIGYAYDNSGNTTNIIYPGNRIVRYSFDAENRLNSITDWNSRVTTFQYNSAGLLTNVLYPNTTTASYQYDAEKRLTKVTHKTAGGSKFVERDILRNAIGYVQQINLQAGLNPVPATGIRKRNTFDAADKLKGSTSNGLSYASYNYDLNGNQTSVTGSIGSSGYTWDKENRLAGVTVGGVTTNHLYDAFGARLRTVGGTSTNYYAVNHAAGLKNVLCEFSVVSGQLSVTRYYIWGPNGLLCQIGADATTTQYYHADEQGSTLALTDGSGTVTDQFAYTPYGECTARTGTTATPYQWLGGVAVRTEGNGLCYMLNRYYSVSQKRFISPDPSGLDGGPNLYAYANLNPLFFTDPFGLCAETSTGYQMRVFGETAAMTDARVYGSGSSGLFDRYTTENNRYGAIAAGMLAVGDLTGATGIYEGISGRDVVSGDSLSAGQRLFRGGMGAVQVASLGVASANIGAGFGNYVGERMAINTMNAEMAGLRATYSAQPMVAEEGGLVIGKMDDLAKPFGWRSGDFTLNLPKLPPGPGRWEQNARELQFHIDKGLPIRDMSPT
jgi:RHS repeat-associated protein